MATRVETKREGRKIDKEVLLQMYRDGYNTAQIAKHFGVTWMAVHMMKQRIDESMASVPDLRRSELSKDNIDTIHQLRNINEHILEELKRCRRLIDREDKFVREREELEDEVKKDPKNTELVNKLKKLAGANIAGILKIQSNIIAVSGEVRQQVKLQVDIFQTLYHVQMVIEFQEEILHILREVDPKICKDVIARLKLRQSMRGLVRMDK